MAKQGCPGSRPTQKLTKRSQSPASIRKTGQPSDSGPNNTLQSRKGGGIFLGLEDGDTAVRRNVGSPETSRLDRSDPSSLPSPSSIYQQR